MRTFSLKRFMCNLAGVFKRIIFLFIILVSVSSYALEEVEVSTENMNWKKFSKEVRLLKESDYRNGLSYIISGSIALAGGLLGESITEDPAERGIYTVFQTIGIASVGYGAYQWKVGGEERALYDALRYTRSLSPKEKSMFLRTYYRQRKLRTKRERVIKAITHGLVAALNVYSATQQDESGVKNALFFVGGVNLLASVSYTFEF